MSVVKHNAPLRDVDWFDITYDCPKWGTTATRVSREQLKTIDGETWYGKHEVITCTKVELVYNRHCEHYEVVVNGLTEFNSQRYEQANYEFEMECV